MTRKGGLIGGSNLKHSFAATPLQRNSVNVIELKLKQKI